MFFTNFRNPKPTSLFICDHAILVSPVCLVKQHAKHLSDEQIIVPYGAYLFWAKCTLHRESLEEEERKRKWEQSAESAAKLFSTAAVEGANLWRSAGSIQSMESFPFGIREEGAESCKNIPDKFRESHSKSSAAHPKIALWSNISTRHSHNLAGMYLHFTVESTPNFFWIDQALLCKVGAGAKLATAAAAESLLCSHYARGSYIVALRCCCICLFVPSVVRLSQCVAWHAPCLSQSA